MQENNEKGRNRRKGKEREGKERKGKQTQTQIGTLDKWVCWFFEDVSACITISLKIGLYITIAEILKAGLTLLLARFGQSDFKIVSCNLLSMFFTCTSSCCFPYTIEPFGFIQ